LVEGFAAGWIALGVTLLLLAIVIGMRAAQWWRESGLPAGDVIYTDSGTWFRQHETLFSSRCGLAGRPDYLIEETDGKITPVEIKSVRAPERPYEGHVMQLAAYCLLVTDHFGVRPEGGIIQYNDRAFAVAFSEALENRLLSVVAHMREDLYREEVDRDHANVRRCAACGHRQHCDQRLA
jgi:CRISPR-associated exonuclease Cas4